MSTQQHTHLYFVGIGGIGMSNLARYFHAKSYHVAGYDKTSTELTTQLQKEGIHIHFEDNTDLIPAEFKNPQTTLVVRTPAVPSDHSELRFFKDKGFKVLKRAQVLGEVSKDSRCLCISGTHGKTTTTTLTAHLLKQSRVDCNAFLGGISNNYNTNLLLSDHSDLTVVEADEYDRSFHQLTPYMAVVTSVDPDHLDIYENHTEYLESFAHFTEKIRPDGCLIIKKNLPLKPRLQAGVKAYTYAVDEPADFYADSIVFQDGRLYFDFHYPQGCISGMELGVPIRINVENAVAALALAHLNGVTDADLKRALAEFRGSKRRFDFIIRRPDFVYIDDYAHHPEELRASIQSIKALYPNKKITGIFQPHLYSRTRDFAAEFAKELSELDDLILLDIYPARELPIPGVNSEMILDQVQTKSKVLIHLEKVFDLLAQKKPEILVTLGAGNIDTLVSKISKYYSVC